MNVNATTSNEGAKRLTMLSNGVAVQTPQVRRERVGSKRRIVGMSANGEGVYAAHAQQVSGEGKGQARRGKNVRRPSNERPVGTRVGRYKQSGGERLQRGRA